MPSGTRLLIFATYDEAPAAGAGNGALSFSAGCDDALARRAEDEAFSFSAGCFNELARSADHGTRGADHGALSIPAG